MAADYSRIFRLLEILTLIQAEKGWTTARLAEALKRNRRTIFRDLEVLRAAGIPCHYDPETKSHYVQKDFFMPPLQLSLDESLAVVALGKHLGAKRQIAFTSSAAKAIDKIRGQLPHKIRQQLDDVDPYVSIKLPHTSRDDGCEDVYDCVRTAISSRRALRCSYEAANRPVGDEIFIFKPYALFFSERDWYTVGHHDGRGALRTLKLRRFSRIESTDSPYAIPDDFSLDKHIGNAWRMIKGKPRCHVELWFDAAFADSISETLWHPTQEIAWHDDGSMTCAFTIDGLDEIVWWVLSMGPHCVVKQPAELMQRVRELAAMTLEHYQA